MSNEFKRTLEVNVNTNVNTKKIQDAEKIISGFFDKYDGESLQIGINTKKAKVDAAEFSKTILKAKELAEEIELVKTNSPSMLPSIKSDITYLDQIKAEFKDVFAVFNDGSSVSGFDAVISKVTDGFAIVAVDLGERINYLYSQITDTVAEFKRLGAVRDDGYGVFGFDNDDMSAGQLQARIGLLKQILESQKELEKFRGQKFSWDEAPSEMSTSGLREHINLLKDNLGELERYNLETTKQLERRQQLIKDSKNGWDWSGDDHDEAKANIHDEDVYQSALDSLNEFIEARRRTIQELKDNEYELFSIDGISEYVDNAMAEITRFEKCKQELQDLKSGKTDEPVIGDISQVVAGLEKVEQAVRDVVNAFKPLTDALANEDSALSKMVQANIADLKKLQQEVQEAFGNIETLSQKQFNMTNVISNGSNAASDVELFRTLKAEARAVYKQVEELYAESITTAQKLKTTPGGLSSFLDFSNTMAAFDMADLAKKVKSRSANSLGVVIDELNEWKKVLLQFNNLRNNVEAGSFNVSQYTDTSSKVRIGNKTNDKDEKAVTDSAAVDNNDILSKIKSLGEQVEVEMTAIRTKIEETLNFDTVDPKIENVKTITDTIYQQFAELHEKIKALDFNIEIPAVLTKVGNDSVVTTDVDATADNTTVSVNKEAESMEQVKTDATAAASAKEDFAKANQKVAATAENTAKQIQEEADELDNVGEVLVKSKNQADKVLGGRKFDTSDLNTFTSQVTAFANELAESKNLRMDNVVATLDPETWAVTGALIKLVNDELGQTVIETYKVNQATEAAEDAVQSLYLAQVKVSQRDMDSKRDLSKSTNILSQTEDQIKRMRAGYEAAFNPIKAITNTNDLRELNAALVNIQNKINEFRDADGNTIKLVSPEDQAEIKSLITSYDLLIKKLQNKTWVASSLRTKDSKTLNAEFAQDLETFKAQIKSSGMTDAMSGVVRNLEADLKNAFDQKTLTAWMNQFDLAKKKLKTLQAESKSKSNTEADDLKYVLSLYQKYATATQALSRMQNDQSGVVHAREIAAATQIAEQAKQDLLDIGVDINKISESELLTEKQKVALLEEQKKHMQEIQTIESKAADRAETKENKEHQKYGKTIYNRENRYAGQIAGRLSAIGDAELNPQFVKTLNDYKDAYAELESLRRKFENNPNAESDTGLTVRFQEAAITVEKLRKEILSTFKEYDKFSNISGEQLLGQDIFDSAQMYDAKTAMMQLAAAVTEGQFQFKGFNAAGTEMYGVVDKGSGVLQEVTVRFCGATNEMKAFTSGTRQVTSSWGKLSSELKNGIKQIVGQYIGFHELWQAIKQGITHVKEIDLAMTELRKVTDETDLAYRNFLTTASKSAATIGSTVSDFTDATAAFARLGYSLEESSKMAETAIVYRNVADGLDTVEESTDSIISTMMAYGVAADDTMSIIDRFNAVGNNFAITSAGIGDAMQRSASALKEGGNTIDESIGLITAANSVIQNPEQVGTALKTLALRLRGAKVELEDAGLDVENMAESTSQLQAKLKALTHGKVDIMLDANTFKNTTQILREMSAAWEDMTDIERASALELMGGKRQAKSTNCPNVQKCA